MNKLHSAVRGVYQSAKEKAAVASVAVATTVLSIQAQAASLLPADALATVATSAQDTATDIVGDLLPVAIAVTITFAVIGWTRKGMGKSGLK